MEFDYLVSVDGEATVLKAMVNFLMEFKGLERGTLLKNIWKLMCTLISSGHLRQGENECTATDRIKCIFHNLGTLEEKKGFQDLNKEERNVAIALFLTVTQGSHDGYCSGSSCLFCPWENGRRQWGDIEALSRVDPTTDDRCAQ